MAQFFIDKGKDVYLQLKNIILKVPKALYKNTKKIPVINTVQFLIILLRQRNHIFDEMIQVLPRKNEKGEFIMKGEFTQKGKEAMERFKMESASEVGVTLKQGYNGDLTAREAGSIGGQMVKKMIDAYKMQ